MHYVYIILNAASLHPQNVLCIYYHQAFLNYHIHFLYRTSSAASLHPQNVSCIYYHQALVHYNMQYVYSILNATSLHSQWLKTEFVLFGSHQKSANIIEINITSQKIVKTDR